MEATLPPDEKVTFSVIEKEGLQNVKVYVQELYSLWMNFGLNSDQKIQRGKIVWKHLQNLLQDILEEEQAFYVNITERIKNYSEKIQTLCNSLSVSPKNDNSTSLTKKEENLRKEYDSLRKLKHKRLKTFQELRSVESVYCSVLGVQEVRLSSTTGIPSENDLVEIDKHIHTLTAERDKRHKKFCLVKKELTTILESTELTPETTLERDILSDSDTVPLTDENFKVMEEVVSKAQKRKTELEARKNFLLNKLSLIWDQLRVPESKRIEFLSKHVDCKLSTLNSIENELDICAKVEKQNAKLYVENMRKELQQLWDMCYASESDKKSFSQFCVSEITDDIKAAHEAEIERWKNYYEEVKPILTKIVKREKLWNLLLEFENKAADPNRFKNRGGNLLQEEKERKKLQKDLPALENKIFCEIDYYEVTNGKHFLYYGEDFRSFVANQWQERTNQKENEKKERRMQNLKQVEKELAMRTPVRRYVLRTPKTAPNRLYECNTNVSSSVYFTPVTRLFKTPCSRVEQSNKKTPKTPHSAVSEKNRNPKKSREDSATSSSNCTTYSEFADELDSSSKQSLRSSVLSTKKVGGTKAFLNSSRGKRKYMSKVHRRSVGNAFKVTPNSTPTRGKLGLPFLI